MPTSYETELDKAIKEFNDILMNYGPNSQLQAAKERILCLEKMVQKEKETYYLPAKNTLENFKEIMSKVDIAPTKSSPKVKFVITEEHEKMLKELFGVKEKDPEITNYPEEQITGIGFIPTLAILQSAFKQLPDPLYAASDITEWHYKTIKSEIILQFFKYEGQWHYNGIVKA